MAKHSEDKIKLIQLDYENGKSISELSLLYGVSQGTIKYWSSNNGWVKKKQNQPTKKPTNRKKKNKTNQKKVVGKTKDIQIKQDILSDVPKEEIMEKHGIKKSAYYVKEKSIRELITNRNKIILESIADKLIPDKEERLIRYKIIKLELLDKIEEATLDNRPENLKQLNDKLNLLAKAEKELYKELRLKVTYEEAEFEKQLAEEETQRNRLEIEKSKQGTEEDKKVEIKIIGVD